jgi:hypothetical protein
VLGVSRALAGNEMNREIAGSTIVRNRSSDRRRAVKKLFVLSVALLLCELSLIGQQGRVGMPTPPVPMGTDDTIASQNEAKLQHRLDMAELQREADDLARTAQTIPSDVANVRKGMLPKDVIQKLKEIEKLSKNLRTKLNP